MTNNELLHASLLDILFDGRNKEYGAYTLRRHYNQRLLLSLGLGLSVILLFILINSLCKNESSTRSDKPDKDGYKMTELATMPDIPEKKEEPKEKPKPQAPKPEKPAATIKNSTIVFVKSLDKSEVPDISDLSNHLSGTETTDGPPADGKVQPALAQANGNGNGDNAVVVNEPPKPSSPPQFPGGFEALRKFLYRHLATPDQLGLEAGEKKIVKVKFTVGKDGSISSVEVIESGGNAFDKEVISVCKKMPAWRPAIQNGEAVSTSYVLPVTFISEEQ